MQTLVEQIAWTSELLTFPSSQHRQRGWWLTCSSGPIKGRLPESLAARLQPAEEGPRNRELDDVAHRALSAGAGLVVASERDGGTCPRARCQCTPPACASAPPACRSAPHAVPMPPPAGAGPTKTKAVPRMRPKHAFLVHFPRVLSSISPARKSNPRAAIRWIPPFPPLDPAASPPHLHGLGLV